MVTTCVMNQSKGHWLLSNVVSIVSCMTIRMRDEKMALDEENKGPDLFDDEFLVFQSHIRDEVIVVLEPFLKFVVSYDPSKAHNILSLMLDPRFKEMKLVTDYIGMGAAVATLP